MSNVSTANKFVRIRRFGYVVLFHLRATRQNGCSFTEARRVIMDVGDRIVINNPLYSQREWTRLLFQDLQDLQAISLISIFRSEGLITRIELTPKGIDFLQRTDFVLQLNETSFIMRGGDPYFHQQWMAMLCERSPIWREIFNINPHSKGSTCQQ